MESNNITNKQVVIVKSQKSVGISLLLTFFFGPLGLFYSSVMGAIIMLVLGVTISLLTAGLGYVLVDLICMIWGAIAVSKYNKKLLNVE